MYPGIGNLCIHRMAALSLVVALSVMLCATLAGCSGSGTRPPQPVSRDFVVRVVDERFVIRLFKPQQIAMARAILSGQEGQKIIAGTLAPGSDGYNRDPVTGRTWSWHLVPETIEFADAAIELCDGLPSHIENDQAYWLGTVRSFCPWSSRLEREIP